MDFELFRPELAAALGRNDRVKGGRLPYNAVMMFRVLVLQTAPRAGVRWRSRPRLSPPEGPRIRPENQAPFYPGQETQP